MSFISKTSPVSITTLHTGTKDLEHAWSLYRQNASTLGFFPRGAFDEFAQAGQIAGAYLESTLVGYVAWRTSRDHNVIVHLCIASTHRGGPGAAELARHVIDASSDHTAIRLTCREDYKAANRLWQRLGFRVVGESVGRGEDQARLLRWQLDLRNLPLFQLKTQLKVDRVVRVVLDANVFFDLLDPERTDHEESSALTADWLSDYVELCVTGELRNEIAKDGYKERRQRALAVISRFQELTHVSADLPEAFSKVAAILPPTGNDADEADQRQLSNAWLGKARYFATRDGVLLDHADTIAEHLNLRVGRPSDIIAWLQGAQLDGTYSPLKLQGSNIVKRVPTYEAELSPFQDFASGEAKSVWNGKIRSLRSAPESCAVHVLGIDVDVPIAVIGVVRKSFFSLDVSVLRSRSHRLKGTLLRRAIADAIELAVKECRVLLTVSERLNAELASILEDLGFLRAPSGVFARYLVQGVFSCQQAATDAVAQIEIQGLGYLQEFVCAEECIWPGKILDGQRETYIVPIQPQWAAALFDHRLAGEELFGVPDDPALALENAYYSASNVTIPTGSRVLWYVSKDKSRNVHAVCAVSRCIGTHIDEATKLSRQFQRLGTYTWAQVLATAKGNPRGRIRAYHFAWTELLINPVPLVDVQKLIQKETGKGNTFASPVRIPESVFAAIYRQGMEQSH